MKKTIQICAGLFLLAWLVATCQAQTPPPVAVTPTCFPRPEATGEKFIGPTVEATPPAQVTQGQVLTVTFSGAYVIGNNAILCAAEVMGHIYSDVLPGFDWNRKIVILLDGQTLETAECAYTCQVKVPLPQNISPGSHQLTLLTGFDRLNFELQLKERD
jgi:hypothetical protein